MARTKMTYLYCLDDHRNLSDEVKKRFTDTSKYRVESCFSRDEFIDHFRRGLEPSGCKIAILSAPESKEQIAKFNDLAIELKKIEPRSGIILLVSQQMEDEIKKTVMYNIDAYVPINQNSVLRIHNAVKNIISGNNILINRAFRNISVYFLVGFLLLAAIMLLLFYLKYPEFF